MCHNIASRTHVPIQALRSEPQVNQRKRKNKDTFIELMVGIQWWKEKCRKFSRSSFQNVEMEPEDEKIRAEKETEKEVNERSTRKE